MWRSARKLRARAGLGKSPARTGLPPLLFFTDPDRTPRPEKAAAGLPRGAGVVFRAFGAIDARARGARLAAVARRRGVLLFVGADPALAARLGADGLHLPQRLATHRGRIARLRERFRVTAAAHDLTSARAAAAAGAEAIVISPVFASASPSAGRALGVRRFRAIVRGVNVPVYALGGVTAASARRLALTGAAGLAAVEALAGPAAARVRT